MSNKTKGLIEMLSATFIWGSTPLASLFSHLPSGVFVFFRVLFAFIFILFILIKKEGISSFFNIKPFGYLFLSGFFLALNWILFFWAIDLAGVNLSVIIYYGGPIFTIVLATIFLKEPFNFKIILSILLVVIGVVLSVGGIDGFNYGAIVALFAAISYGFLGFFSKLATTKHSSYKVTTWQILISIFLTLPFAIFQDYTLTTTTIAIVVVTGLIHTAFALFLWYDSLKYIPVSLASILAYLDIFFAMILSWLFLDQMPTLNQIIGSILIVVAGAIATLL
jgi:RarD protein